MSEDLFSTNSQEDERREGRFSSDKNSNGGTPERARFVRKERAGSSDYSGYQRPRFNPNNSYERPARFNREADTDAPRPYRPRFQSRGEGSSEGGYQRRSYSDDRQGSYTPRTDYNRDNRFSKRPGSYDRFNRDGGYGQDRFNQDRPQRPYRPSYERDENRDGGERPYRSSYNRGENRDGRPAPRFNRGGGYNRDFNREGGFQKRPQRRSFNSNYDPNAKYSQKKRIEYQEKNVDPNAPIRLNKFLANAGVCSRRDADKYIESGVVTVNGEVVTELGTKVTRTDNVMFHDQPVRLEKKVYVLLNKPKGYVTTSDDPQNRKIVMDLVKNACPERIYPVGRLDRSTTGVLLFTNDGELASKLTHPKYLKKKIYHVYLDHNVTAADMRQIAEGITLEDGEIKADSIEYASETDKKQVGIEIHSGKNRIVRRIFESLGYHVVKLDRVYFAGLTKKNVKRGDWRYLTEKEVDMLKMGAFE